jgi:hypothetical protein
MTQGPLFDCLRMNLPADSCAMYAYPSLFNQYHQFLSRQKELVHRLASSSVLVAGTTLYTLFERAATSIHEQKRRKEVVPFSISKPNTHFGTLDSFIRR